MLFAMARAAAATLRVRPARSIYSVRGGWFRARWHFSFDRYSDADHMGIGALRVFNHDTLVPGAVWPMHPHRDIEGITYVVAGQFEHADSLGNDGVLAPGGVQRMRLGRGAEHSERNHSPTEEMEFIQMWILPWRRGLEPGLEQRQYTAADRTDRLLRFLKPEGADGEGVTVAQDVAMYAARLSPGAVVAHEVAPGRGGYLYVIDGSVAANDERLGRGDAAYCGVRAAHTPSSRPEERSSEDYVVSAGELRLSTEATAELLIVDTPL